MIFRVGAFCLVCLLSLTLPLWLSMVVVAMYAMRWFGLELIVLAAAIDVTFGMYHWPLYTLATVAIVAVVEWWKPALSVY